MLFCIHFDVRDTLYEYVGTLELMWFQRFIFKYLLYFCYNKKGAAVIHL